MAHESDPHIAEAIVHSRKEAGAHNTNSLEIARQHNARTNRPLTRAEKMARAPIGWAIRQKEATVTEPAKNPIKRKSQEPDQQDKTTVERVEKQDVTEEEIELSKAESEKAAGTADRDFVTGTASPDKEG